jgi:2-iminobutanoate/2-iminopropanoate deaminase
VARQAGNTQSAPAPVGPYSQSVRIAGLVAAAGQGADDPATGHLAGPDIETQTRQCLRNLEAVLAASGAGLDDVIRVGVFLAHKEDFDGMNRVYRETFGEPFPARTTVYVGLPGELRVEIDALAVPENP